MIRALIRSSGPVIFALLAMGTAAAQDADEGKQFVEEHCASCHAIGKSGPSPYEKAPPFRDIVKKYPVENLAEAFAEGISVGHQAMPEFQFEPEKIDMLLSYLASLNE